MQDAYVHQLGRGYSNGASSKVNGGSGKVKPLRSYKFHSVFPVNVSSIDLSYDSSDTIEEYTVEFAVQSITVGEDQQGNSDQNGTKISGF
jgi:hypothetical protein